MEIFIPMSIIFTKRQWTLLKRYQIKHVETVEQEKHLQAQLDYVYFMFNILLHSSLVFMALYAVGNAIYFYAALLVDPCNQDIGKCPALTWVAMLILTAQILMYVNYTICSILLFISVKRIYITIRET